MLSPDPNNFNMTEEEYISIQTRYNLSVDKRDNLLEKEGFIVGGVTFVCVVADLWFIKQGFSVYPLGVFLVYQFIKVMRGDEPLIPYRKYTPKPSFFEYEDYLLTYRVWERQHKKEQAIESRKQQLLKEKRQKALNRKNFSYWSSIDPYEFEREIAVLFESKGFQVTVTKGSGDGGIDILMSKDNKKSIVQCKRYKTKVSPSTVRDLYGVMVSGKYHAGYVVCPSGFSKKSFEFSKDKKIVLIGLKRIMEMVNQDEVDFLIE